MSRDPYAPAMECRRSSFSLPADVHYFNCAYMGPLPLAAQEAGVAGIRRKAVPAAIAPADFFAESDQARDLFASIIGAADPGRVAILPSVSYGMATAARNLSCEPGRTIVITGEQFPSNVYAWRRRADATGGEIRVVGPPDPPREGHDGRPRGERWSDAIAEAIDENTAIVAIPQVHWTDGTRFDLERIGARARAVGAAFIIDGTQSIGAMPFDLARTGADAVICAAYKWLLGPYSLAFGWFGPRFDGGVPIEETWIGREGSDDFQRLVEYRDSYQPGAVRYDVGERSNFILLPMAIASMSLILEWGAGAIQVYCEALLQPVLEEAEALGYRSEQRNWRGAHLLGLRMPPGVDLGALAAEMAARNVMASLRGSALRIAPHVYNDHADAAALLAALRAAAP
ncbi:MAG TPA: aminotransferase class V-fold PLP-dependent enzyme [Longimicrobiales bacterium]|nr:aminotransferase class V-fold PLP-dependent enzyme [Longimicrobiales bacterium]